MVVLLIAIIYTVDGSAQQLGGGIFDTEVAMEYWKRRYLNKLWLVGVST